jgi:hypothetical protein
MHTPILPVWRKGNAQIAAGLLDAQAGDCTSNHKLLIRLVQCGFFFPATQHQEDKKSADSKERSGEKRRCETA